VAAGGCQGEIPIKHPGQKDLSGCGSRCVGRASNPPWEIDGQDARSTQLNRWQLRSTYSDAAPKLEEETEEEDTVHVARLTIKIGDYQP
jgi:hypothetical protein